MTQIVPLNKEAHRTLKVDGRASAAYGDSQHFAQVIVNEFAQLVVRYPILFAKNANTGQFYCGAMLGFDDGENLFLEEWQERDTYRPLSLQRMPFYARGPQIAIDLDHPRVGVEGGQALFEPTGRPSRYLQGIIWAFRDLKPGIETTKVFIARLLELKLIEPIDIEVELDDGTTHKCAGLYTINQDVLAKLPDAVVLELFRRGYLTLVHLMIASLKQLPLMARRKNSRLLEGTSHIAGLRMPGTA
jgi:SapC protein